MYFKDIAHEIRNRKKIEHVDWKGYASMCRIRMNSLVRQYDGFTPGRRVYGGTPKLPMGTTGKLIFWDFRNKNDFLVKHTSSAAKLREI